MKCLKIPCILHGYFLRFKTYEEVYEIFWFLSVMCAFLSHASSLALWMSIINMTGVNYQSISLVQKGFQAYNSGAVVRGVNSK